MIDSVSAFTAAFNPSIGDSLSMGTIVKYWNAIPRHQAATKAHRKLAHSIEPRIIAPDA